MNLNDENVLFNVASSFILSISPLVISLSCISDSAKLAKSGLKTGNSSLAPFYLISIDTTTVRSVI